jgi:hypothetical protein
MADCELAIQVRFARKLKRLIFQATHMNSGRLFLLGIAWVALLGFSPGNSVAGTKGITGADAFAVIKSLAGEWHGTVSEQGRPPEVTVLYRVTSAGSAVLETLFPGTDHEMVTVYHLDNKRLILTHYCAAGNQPRMALKKDSTPTDLVFDFAGGTNLDPGKDPHMHSAHIHIESPDRIVGEWVGYQDGRKVETTRFSLTRKK